MELAIVFLQKMLNQEDRNMDIRNDYDLKYPVFTDEEEIEILKNFV